jgi:hypothetical protein
VGEVGRTVGDPLATFCGCSSRADETAVVKRWKSGKGEEERDERYERRDDETTTTRRPERVRTDCFAVRQKHSYNLPCTFHPSLHFDPRAMKCLMRPSVDES